MRILICAHHAPLPPHEGFTLYLSSILGQLRRRHDVRVLALRRPDQAPSGADDDNMRVLSPEPASRARQVRSLARAFVRRRPFSADDLAAQLRGALREEMEHFDPDIVHVAGPLAALAPELEGRPSVLAVIDAPHLNFEARARASTGFYRLLLKTEGARSRRFAATEYRPFPVLTVVSEADRDALLSLDPTLDIRVIPNGVDLNAYADDGSGRDPTRVLFTGTMRYAPNVTAAEFLAKEVMPVVWARRPDVKLAIVGRAPSARVRALGEVHGIEVVGPVDDMRTWLSRGRVYACPMVSGTGIKNKLLEAMANGLPCVVTPLALQGLEVDPGHHLLVADDPNGLAMHLLAVLEDDALADSLGRAARDYVAARHTWQAAAEAYERVYNEALDRSATVAPR